MNETKKRELWDQKICAGLTTKDKRALWKLREQTHESYAKLIRDALKLAYPDVITDCYDEPIPKKRRKA